MNSQGETTTGRQRWWRIANAMFPSSGAIIYAERRTGYVWIPIVLLLAIIVATWMTQQFIFPFNKQMAAGIDNQTTLNGVLKSWMSLNGIRVWIWTLQRVTIASDFGLKAVRTPRHATVAA